VLNDVRLTLRGLLKAPAFSAVIVLTLAVAIGANTAIYSVVEAVLLRPLPYADPNRIVRIAATTIPTAPGPRQLPFSDRGYWHFADNNRSFESFGGFAAQDLRVPLTGDGTPVQVQVARVTVSAFEVLGVLPERGRLPTAEEDIPDAPWVALLAHELWVDRFGSDPGIIGRTVELNGTTVEVIGVMPARFDFPSPDTDAWTTYRLNPASENYGGHHIEGLARLAPDATPASAEEDAESLIARFPEVGYGAQWFTGVFDGGARVWTLQEDVVGDARLPLLVLLGTVAFVLLIACSNVANLLLVRGETRTRERAVRLALGSGRGRLVRLALTESVLLALMGGAAGVLLAWLGVRALVAMAPPSIPRLDEIGIRGSVLAFTLAVSVLAGLLFGTFPALRTGSRKSLAALRDGGRGPTIGRERHRTRSLLVVTQVALALVLLVGSGLMVRSFRQLSAVDPGFDGRGVLTFSVKPLPTKYQGPEGYAGFFDQLRERLEGLAGVTTAGGVNNLPLTGGGARLTTVIEEFPPAEDEFPPVFLVRRATPGYFEALDVPVVEGRSFTADDHNLRLGSVVISASVKEQYWPTTSALGKRISVAGIPTTVVGVVGDVHDASLELPADQFVYLPMLDSVGGGVAELTMAVETEGDPLALVPAVRAAIERLDPDVPISEVRTLETVVADSLSRTTFTMTLLVLGAAVALFLGSVGIYGVISYIVTQRTAEIGVRLALGASPGSLGALVLSQGMRLAAAGVVVGLLAALGLGRVIASLLYGVTPMDPVALVAGSLSFLAVAAVATLVPAMRAARTPPAEALRGGD